MVFGDLHHGEVEVEDFQNLKDGETFFLVLRDAGNDGDYIFNLTPELKLECDMHQIDLTKHGLMVIKAKYVKGEYSGFQLASNWLSKTYDPVVEQEYENLRKKSRSEEGLYLECARMFDLDKDNDTPAELGEVIERIEDYDYDEYHSWESPTRGNPF
jgi:hypothetical protein